MDNLVYVRYSRKSSESKERQVLSINDQNKECEEYVNRTGICVKYQISEEKSAFKPNRRVKFDEMVELIKSSKANAILTWKPDRITRNPLEGGVILQLLQDGILKEIRTVQGDIYTPESDTLILQMHFGMANQFSKNLSQNVRRGLNRKVRDRKEYPFPAPIGYEGYGEPRRRNIRPFHQESSYIKEAFEMASTGLYSYAQIVDILYQKGFRTKKGKKVGKSHLSNILHCPTYYGYFLYRGELFEGNYNPIISKGSFDLAGKMLNDRSRSKKKVWDRDFAGLFKCADCGCAITTSIKKKLIKRESRFAFYTYHHCTHRRGACNQKPINDIDFKKLLYEKLDEITIDQEVWQLGLKLVHKKYSEELSRSKNHLHKINQQREDLRDKLNTLVDMRIKNELSSEEFIDQKNRMSEKLSTLGSLSLDNDDSFKSWLELSEEYFNTAFQAREVLENGTIEEKQIILRKIGENFVFKDKKIDMTFKMPYDILLKPSVRTNVLGSMDSNHE